MLYFEKRRFKYYSFVFELVVKDNRYRDVK